MEELDLKELFKVIWDEKVQEILIIAIFLVLGIMYTFGLKVPKYSASTTLVLAQSDKNKVTENTITTADITINSKLVSTYSELIKSKNVLRQVKANLNIDVNEDDIRNNVSVTQLKDTELIEITVSNENPIYAEKIANEIAKVFTEKVKEIYNMDNIKTVDTAEKPTAPLNVNQQKDILIFIFIGIIVSILYALIINILDTTIKTSEDVERICDLPVLASIPIFDVGQPKKKGGKNR